MKTYFGITVPAWIFILTLVLVVASGGIVGGRSCERAVRNCEGSAMQTHPDNLALRQAYVSRCAESACSSGKSGAVLPFSILIFGVVVYAIWLRTSDSSDSGSSAKNTGSAASESAPTGSGVAPGSTQAPAAAPTASAPPPASTAVPAPAVRASPRADESADYLHALLADGEQSKEELARWLCRRTGVSDADRWKGAPAGDLALLQRAIATAAALGPADSKYSGRLDADSTRGEADARTKKALQQQCIDVLRADLSTLASAGVYPEGLSEGAVRETVKALDAEDALAGLSRLSKATLVSLAAFLDGRRA